MKNIAKNFKLSVVGLGKLGAPMAAVFAAKGYDVIGVDINDINVRLLNENIAPVDEPDLQIVLDRARGRIKATTDYDEAIQNTDMSFIIVPTPSGPDGLFTNKYVIEAVKKIGKSLRRNKKYHVVVITSTVIPGSTGGEIRLALEEASGRIVGTDIGLCYSPEFIALGSVIRDMLNPDMVLIGQSDAKAGDMLESVYLNSTDSNPEIHRMNFINAELCKITVNTFVTTKISYANMVAEMCDHLPGANANIVAEAIGADSRIGRKYLKPAIGYGGPCFPRDNKAFYSFGKKLGVNCSLAEATDNINIHQLSRLHNAVEKLDRKGAQLAILGLSYKPKTNVIEQSQGIALAINLSAAGYKVRAYDPLANNEALKVFGSQVQVSVSLEEAINNSEIAIVMTPWPQFEKIDWSSLKIDQEKFVVIDPWGIVKLQSAIKLVQLGVS